MNPTRAGANAGFLLKPNAEIVREYVQDAVKTHGGCFHPDDPLFGIDYDQIEVLAFRARRNDKSRMA